MDRATLEMRSLAKDLMDFETSRNRAFKATGAAAFIVTERLRPHLSNLMGNGGFRALLARALVLASAEVSWLGAISVKADGTLDMVDGLGGQLDPAEFLEGRIVLVAQLLGLLMAFIGPTLTSSLVSEIWPKLRPTIPISTESEVQSEKGN